MKKQILLGLMLVVMMIGNVFGEGRMSGGMRGVQGGFKGSFDEEKRIQAMFPDGLTFYKDFTASQTGDANSLNADFSLGSPTGTFTASRGATNPATYVDAAGIIQLTTTSNIPRFQGGYYDSTGFHAGNSGIMFETAATNLITKCNNVEDDIWTKTNITADNDDAGSSSPDGTATAPSLTASGANGTFLLASGVTAQTYSVFIKRKTGTGKIYLTANGGTNYTEITVPASGWARFSETRASASQTCGIKIETSGDAIYIFYNQFENNPYMTSPIPTTTAALTRNAEVLKYPTLNNRTAAQETIVIKFMPSSDFANDGVVRYLLSTDTKSRSIAKTPSGTVIQFQPNATDNSAVTTATVTSPLINNSYVYGATVINSPSSYKGYLNGTQEGTTGSTAWTIPNWGTSFYLGSSNIGVQQLNGIVQSVSFFNRVLSNSEVTAGTNILNQD